MIDKSIEWLEWLYVRRPATPEADMAKDVLDRLAALDQFESGRDEELEEALDDVASAKTAQHDAEYETRRVLTRSIRIALTKPLK